jgi:hypothetical protein
MTVLFRLVYSLAVAILYILFVVFGVRTLYSEPDAPEYPGGRLPPQVFISCDPDGACYREEFNTSTNMPERVEITPAVEETLTTDEREYLTALRAYDDDLKDYDGEREDYFRNVFVIAAFFGVLAIAGGVAMYRRVEAMPLGLVLGGIGSLSYGWVEWERGPEEAGTAVVFGVVTVGLILVLGGGYYFLGDREKATP